MTLQARRLDHPTATCRRRRSWPTSWPRPSADERSNSRYRSGRSAPAAGASTACRTGPDCGCARTESHGDRVAAGSGCVASRPPGGDGRRECWPESRCRHGSRRWCLIEGSWRQCPRTFRAVELAAKLVSLFPANAGTRLPTHQAVVIVFDADCGEPQALLDGTSITTLRTAAGSALSAELLAREDAATLAILGTGVQARAHAEAMVRVRRIQLIRVAGRNPDRVASLCGALQDSLGIPALGADNYQDACADADLICAATHSPDPVVRREYLKPGVHVTSVGTTRPAARWTQRAFAMPSWWWSLAKRCSHHPRPGAMTSGHRSKRG